MASPQQQPWVPSVGPGRCSSCTQTTADGQGGSVSSRQTMSSRLPLQYACVSAMDCCCLQACRCTLHFYKLAVLCCRYTHMVNKGAPLCQHPDSAAWSPVGLRSHCQPPVWLAYKLDHLHTCTPVGSTTQLWCLRGAGASHYRVTDQGSWPQRTPGWPGEACSEQLPTRVTVRVTTWLRCAVQVTRPGVRLNPSAHQHEELGQHQHS